MISTRSNSLVSYISMQDPAMGAPLDEWFGKWFRSLKFEDIPVKDGAVPTIFVLKRLSRRDSMRIGIGVDDLTPAQQCEVVACGLKDVKNWDGLNVVLTGNGDRERMSDETLDRIYAPALIHELATVIVRLSSLAPLAE